jgi:hypothetical protein
MGPVDFQRAEIQRRGRFYAVSEAARNFSRPSPRASVFPERGYSGELLDNRRAVVLASSFAAELVID